MNRRERYASDPEYRKRTRLQAIKSYYANREKNLKTKKVRYYANRSRLTAQASAVRWQLKLDMIAAYGGKCQCLGCTVSHPVVMTLEHKGGGGRAHRKLVGASHVMRDLKRRGWPKDKFTVLCMNCNHARGVKGQCPHELGEIL